MDQAPPRRLSLLLALAAILVGAPSSLAAAPTPPTYENPVSRPFADTFADPAIIRGKDGWWYAYATTDPLREGEGRFHVIPTARSRNLVDWTYLGDAFGARNRPSWAEATAGIWAPDVRYIDGRYVMYFGVTDTTLYAGANDSAIGVATAPTPTGPWTPADEPVVGPRVVDAATGNFLWTFDATGFTDVDGSHYLYFGSYYGGVSVTRLTDDGTRAVGSATQVAINDRFEAPYVVRRDGWYYFFGSSANCCAGPTTGYSVSVGRSRSPLGPFVDREGASLTESRAGGTPVVTPNGNRWIGTGHNALVTDFSGQDFLVYHAIPREDPFLDEPFGINERPMLLDRLDWIEGWPVVRAGAFASESGERAPIGRPAAGSDLNAGGRALRAFAARGGSWRVVAGPGGGAVEQRDASPRPAFLLVRSAQGGDVRVEADVRLAGGRAVGLVVRRSSAGRQVVVWLDRQERALVIEVVVDGDRSRHAVGLPEGLDLGIWRNLAVEVRGRELRAELTDARLRDPYAVATHTLPATLATGASAGVAALGRAQADNVAVTPLHVPPTTLVGTPTPATLSAAHSDEFEDAALGPEWTWVRAPDGQETGGAFVWPTQQADLYQTNNSASVLLRDAPAGDYVVETKLTIDLGVDEVLNFQQGGLVAYVSDDHYVRFMNVAIWNTRQLEFAKEMPFADRISFGGMTAFGPTADTVWLRLAHRVDPENGEHEFRAGKSLDGTTWTWGGVWTLPAGTAPRVGLLSLGRGEGQRTATSRFDWFRVYTGGSWNG